MSRPAFYPSASTSSASRVLYPGSTVGTDLRAEFKAILEGDSFNLQQGHWVVFRRLDITEKSIYWDEGYRESPGGPPYEYTEESVLCRYRSITSGGLTRFFEMDTQTGVIHVDFRIYYLEYSVAPEIQDEIYELDWNDHTVRPNPMDSTLVRTEKFNINDIYPLRGDYGRIEFYACLCRRENVKT